MIKKQYEKHLKQIRAQALESLPQFINEIYNAQQIENEEIKQLSDEFQIETDFDFNFKVKFLEFLLNLLKQKLIKENISDPPKKIEDLFLGTYLNFKSVPKLERNPILKIYIQHINKRIHEIFNHNNKLLLFLIEQEKYFIQIENQTQSQQNDNENDIIIEITKEEHKTDNKQRKLKRKLEQIISNAQQEDITITRQELLLLAKYSQPSQEQLKCLFCICKKIYIPNVKPAIQRCVVCQHFFHLSCLQLEQPKKIFVCAECIIVQIDPLNEFQDCLIEPTVFESINGIQNIYKENFTIKQNQVAQLRCLRLDSHYDEITWPDSGDITINDQKILDLNPLTHNSSLKKRKDEKILLPSEYNKLNKLVIKENYLNESECDNYRITQGIPYLIAVFSITHYTPKEFINKVKKECIMGIEQSKRMIRLSIMEFDDVKVESIKVSLECSFNFSIMQTPVRGNLCEHIQCFSLENMTTMINQISPRRWRCPLCKQLILSLLIDTYQLNLINIIKKNQLDIKEITFDRFGDIQLQGLSDSELIKNKQLKNFMTEQESLLTQQEKNNINLRIISLEQMARRAQQINEFKYQDIQEQNNKQNSIVSHNQYSKQVQQISQQNSTLIEGNEIDPIIID